MNPFRTLQTFFGARLFTWDHRLVWSAWLATEAEAALIDPCSGRVLALIEHDGYGKYYPVVFVSPWRALQLIREHRGYLVSAQGFPWFTLELVRYKADGMAVALEEFEQDYFGHGE